MPEGCRAFAAALLATLIPFSSGAQEIGAFGDALTSRAVRAVLIVAPDYPKEAVARGEAATIDVHARVKTDGTLAEWKLPETKALQPFVAAIREVLPFWVMMPRLDEATCRSREDDVQIRVWFEIVDGKAKISVSQAAETPKEARQAKAAEGARAMLPKVKRSPVYPKEAIRKGIDDVTLAAVLRVERSGTVSGVEVRPGAHREWFEPAIVKALSQWQFEILPGFPSEKAHLCGEVILNFRLTDSQIPYKDD